MQNFWDRLKIGIREGATVSAERVETYSKIGKLKIDQLNLKNKIKKNEHALGVLLYHVVKNGSLSSIENNDEVRDIISVIDTSQESINSIAHTIAEIKAEKLADNKKDAMGDDTTDEVVNTDTTPEDAQ